MTATQCELAATAQKLRGLSRRWWEQDCSTAVGGRAGTEGCFLAHLSGTCRYQSPAPTPSREVKAQERRYRYWRSGSSHALASFSRVPRQAEGQEVSGAQPGCDLPHREPQKWLVTFVVLCLGFSELGEHLGIGESLPRTSADKALARFYLPLTLVK